MSEFFRKVWNADGFVWRTVGKEGKSRRDDGEVVERSAERAERSAGNRGGKTAPNGRNGETGRACKLELNQFSMESDPP